ncbi:class I SAM-dependent methyltransferase [Methylomarinum sp. Ch1-1]|uniref:Ribosomal RNA small subunit methyltransferase J n=1 Tax=Methylomarinum roseum TaxID=3067653 RepID=A0AAU7NRM0_9GAMM|nr:class I SAM-dependent methyltransferase [Methylomarinum sp. Ch1-1]MDP4520381.1 class I SAM-dependent methyltransferase [Methylomarinum sp. Ch1-1]
MTDHSSPRDARIALAYQTDDDKLDQQKLADRLALPLMPLADIVGNAELQFCLIYRDGCLKLLDRQALKKGGLAVDIEPRSGEQHSWPAPKKSLFAQAIGKKTRTVVDATTGWAQDSLALFRMGYAVTCIERSPLMAELVADGFARLAGKDWVRRRSLTPPQLLVGDAIEILRHLPEQPDCIYLDPMFPPKRKKSALAKKSMTILRDILGDDLDRDALFVAAMEATGKRVVVKSPDYAEPLGGKPTQSFQGKLLRYDVYLKSC